MYILYIFDYFIMILQHVILVRCTIRRNRTQLLIKLQIHLKYIYILIVLTYIYLKYIYTRIVLSNIYLKQIYCTVLPNYGINHKLKVYNGLTYQVNLFYAWWIYWNWNSERVKNSKYLQTPLSVQSKHYMTFCHNYYIFTKWLRAVCFWSSSNNGCDKAHNT